MREWTTFDQHADRWGFAIAYPDGLGGCWADGRGVTSANLAGVDDTAFLRAIIDWSATTTARRPIARWWPGSPTARSWPPARRGGERPGARRGGGRRRAARDRARRPADARRVGDPDARHGGLHRADRHRLPPTPRTMGLAARLDTLAVGHRRALAGDEPLLARSGPDAHNGVVQPHHHRGRGRRHPGRHVDDLRRRPEWENRPPTSSTGPRRSAASPNAYSPPRPRGSSDPYTSHHITTRRHRWQ